MGYKGGNSFNPFARTDREVRRITNNMAKGALLGGLMVANYICNQPQQMHGQYTPLTDQEIKELDLQLAKPFRFTRSIAVYSILHLLAIASPIVGIYLYTNGIWMFFCVFIFGFTQFMFNAPSLCIEDNIKLYWKLSKTDKPKQLRQLKILIYQALTTNIILILLNSYPFIVSYEGGILVTLMTAFLYFFNVWSIIENAKIIKKLDVLFEENLTKFSPSQKTKDIVKETPHQDISDTEAIYTSNDTKKIYKFVECCNNKETSLIVHKAIIRILNAIINGCKKGYSEISYDVIEQELDEKIRLAKREFVKRECLISKDILRSLRTQNIDNTIEYLKHRYPY